MGGFIDGPIKVAWFIPVVVFMLYRPGYIIFRNRYSPLNFVYVVLLCSFIVGTVGLVFEYNAIYVFGDLIKMSSFWCTLAIVLNSLDKSNSYEGVLKKFLYLVLYSGVFDALYALYVSSISVVKVHNVAYLYALIIVMTCSKYVRLKAGIKTILVLLFVLAACYSGKRFNLIISFVILFLYGYLKQRSLGKILYCLVIVLLSFGVYFVFKFDIMGGALYEIKGVKNFIYLIEDVQSGEGDQSYEGRMYELYNVLEHYVRHPFQIVTGSGLGASINMIYDTHVYDSDGNMHHAHILWVVLLLRVGIIGCLFFICFFIFWMGLVIKFKLKNSHSFYDSGGLYSFLVFFLTLAASFKSNTFISDSGLIIGVALYLVSINKNQCFYRKSMILNKYSFR